MCIAADPQCVQDAFARPGGCDDGERAAAQASATATTPIALTTPDGVVARSRPAASERTVRASDGNTSPTRVPDADAEHGESAIRIRTPPSRPRSENDSSPLGGGDVDSGILGRRGQRGHRRGQLPGDRHRPQRTGPTGCRGRRRPRPAR